MMFKKFCCAFLVVFMLFSSFRISAEDVDEVGYTSDVSINMDETTADTDVKPFEETVEFSIPTDEESFLNPEMGLEYSEPYTAQTGDVFGGGTSDIMPMMLPFTDSIRAGIKSFQQYINENLPMSYLERKLSTTGSINNQTKTAAIKLIQYRLNQLGAGLTVDGAFGPASQAAFSKYVGTIERYSSGVWVYILQGLLYCHLYDPNGFDGSYGVNGGTGCLNAVNSLKTRNLITEGGSGSVGIKTMMCLTWRTPERTVDDGVYYIQNTLGTYLHAQNGGLSSGTNVYACFKYADGTAVTTQLRQLWKVTYLGDGFYTIRPMHKSNMALTVENGNAILKPADPQNAQFKWEIYEYDLGIIIRHKGDTSQKLYIAGDSTAEGANVCAGSNYSSYQKWSFIKIENPPEGAVIYNTSSLSIITNGHRWIAKDDFAATFYAFDMAPTFYSPYTDSQDFTWTSSDTSVATASQGMFLGKDVGTVLIQGRKVRGDRVYYVSFNLHVKPLANGIHYIQNKATQKYMDIENQNMSNGTQIHQWDFHGGTTQVWRLKLDHSSGYYTIQSERNSSYYLGVQNDSTANDVSVVLRSGTITDGMKWDIAVSSHGNYVLTPKTGVANNHHRVLAVEYYVSNSNGLDMQQRDFVDDSNFKDEWMIYSYKRYGLAYLGYLAGHSPAAERVAWGVCDRWGPNGYAYLNLSKQTALGVMSSVGVFSCITHGKQNSIELANGEELTSTDINALSSDAFRSLDLVYYGACLTGSGGTNNLVHATLNKGAAAVIGFKHEVDPGATYYWTQEFMCALASKHVTIQEAMDYADEVTGNHPDYREHTRWSVHEPDDRLAIGDLDITVYY